MQAKQNPYSKIPPLLSRFRLCLLPFMNCFKNNKKMSSREGTGTFVIHCAYIFIMLLVTCLVGLEIYLDTKDGGCRKSLVPPMLGLGAVILVISFIGSLGAVKKNAILLLIYLIVLCFILIAILIFTVLAFIVTKNGSGHRVSGLRYKEYQLGDYNTLLLRELNNSRNWKDLKTCLVEYPICDPLSEKYRSLRQYKMAKLDPIEAGCCRPPSECGYPAVNASYYDLSYHPTSSHKDCKLYKNEESVKCYDCDSCKAGVAQYMKVEWRVVAIFSVALLIFLPMVYCIGCCTRRNPVGIDPEE